MLFQIHHQSKKNGATKMVAQNEIGNNKEMDDWSADVQKRHPLPEGQKWFFCNEKSRYFTKVAK